MLRNEHRMATERRLLAIVPRRCRCETPRNELFRLDEHSLESTLLDIRPLARTELKASAKEDLASAVKRSSSERTDYVAGEARSAFSNRYVNSS